MAQRIKGQEVALTLISPDGNVDDLVDFQSFEGEFDIEILEEGYLGETAQRYDDIYNGASGNAELHVENAKFFVFQQAVQDRAQRRSAAELQFNAVVGFSFPDGTRGRLFFEDIFFGALPIRSPGRKDYVQLKVEWKCSNVRRVV